MRPGEVDGQKFNFVSRDAFAGYVRDGKLLELSEHNGIFYGTMKLGQHDMKQVGSCTRVWRNSI
jgi:guanylate kinase